MCPLKPSNDLSSFELTLSWPCAAVDFTEIRPAPLLLLPSRCEQFTWNFQFRDKLSNGTSDVGINTVFYAGLFDDVLYTGRCYQCRYAGEEKTREKMSDVRVTDCFSHALPRDCQFLSSLIFAHKISGRLSFLPAPWRCNRLSHIKMSFVLQRVYPTWEPDKFTDAPSGP